MEGMMAHLSSMNKETFEKNAPLVDISDFEFEAEKGVMIKIWMIKPKSLPAENNAAYIYAHGDHIFGREHDFKLSFLKLSSTRQHTTHALAY